MNIGLIGYGKMGKAIEDVALRSGHTIAWKVSSPDFDLKDMPKAEAAIEFTRPEAAVTNIYKCFDAGLPVVVGTTGWYDQFETVKQKAVDGDHTLFYATNFSLGVNLFFQLNKYLARLMNGHPDYEPDLFEAHHILKKDAPSGTAITLAEGILKELDRKNRWVHRDEQNTAAPGAFDLKIESLREGEIPGTHTITYRSTIDEISITHQAYNRLGFATGAVRAAEWIAGKTGVYSMAEMLGFNQQ